MYATSQHIARHLVAHCIKKRGGCLIAVVNDAATTRARGVGDAEHLGGTAVGKHELHVGVEHHDGIAGGIEGTNELVVESIVGGDGGDVLGCADITECVATGITNWRGRKCNYDIAAIQVVQPKMGNECVGRGLRGNPPRLEFGARGGQSMRPRRNTEREWGTTQREHAECVVGRRQATGYVSFAKCDRKRSERAIDTPSISGFVPAKREHGPRLTHGAWT